MHDDSKRTAEVKKLREWLKESYLHCAADDDVGVYYYCIFCVRKGRYGKETVEVDHAVDCPVFTPDGEFK